MTLWVKAVLQWWICLCCLVFLVTSQLTSSENFPVSCYSLSSTRASLNHLYRHLSLSIRHLFLTPCFCRPQSNICTFHCALDMYASVQLMSWAHGSPTFVRTGLLWTTGVELCADAQKDHCSPGSQYEKQLPKENLPTSCQGVKRNDNLTDRVTNKEWQAWSDKCGVPRHRNWSVGNVQKTPILRNGEEGQTAST